MDRFEKRVDRWLMPKRVCSFDWSCSVVWESLAGGLGMILPALAM
jgi:hypothetical protein